ncbi:unnamed protein product [Vicia faba]|uniref:DUF4408 domain-containing protein n=1 Tax=Vicia faba TaxID=3906 RepID=A0AAV0YED3_VICFA|nr:unnamed protein product [Vicia faba]
MGSITLHKHKAERFNKVQKHSQLRKITDLLRYVEMCVVLVLISRLSFQQLPLALKNSTEYFRGFEISPGFVFLIGNVIIITLFAQSGHFSNDSSKRKSSEHDLYLEFLQNSNMYQRIQGCDQRKVSVKVENNLKGRRIIDGCVVKVCKKDVKKSDEQGMETEMDLEVKEYRRCQSETALVKGVDSDNEKDQKVLQRCESENEKRKMRSIEVDKEKKKMVKNSKATINEVQSFYS